MVSRITPLEIVIHNISDHFVSLAPMTDEKEIKTQRAILMQ